MKNSRKLAFSGLTVALYIIIMYCTQSFSFGQYQVRLATGLYSLSYNFPFLCLPLGLANMISNIIFGGDIINGFLGFVAGTLSCICIRLLKKITTKRLIIVLPIAVIPSLIIPIWLSLTLQVPYYLLVLSLFIGQTISAYTMGIFILLFSEKINKK